MVVEKSEYEERMEKLKEQLEKDSVDKKWEEFMRRLENQNARKNKRKLPAWMLLFYRRTS